MILMRIRKKPVPFFMLRPCQVDTEIIQIIFTHLASFEAGCICAPGAERSVAEVSPWSVAGHATYFALYFLMRLFSGIGYCFGSALASASVRISAGALNPNLAWYLPSL